MSKFLGILLSLLSLSFILCAYSFQAGSFEGTVSIPTLENRTRSSEVQRVLTEELKDSFIEDGRVKIDSDGDFILSGVVEEYEREPETFTPAGDIQEYRISVRVKFTLRERGADEIEWEKTVTEASVYDASEDESVGVEKVSERIRDSLLRFMLESW